MMCLRLERAGMCSCLHLPICRICWACVLVGAETTVYEPRYTVWKADRGQSQPFTLKMRVRYRPQRICYRPGFMYELKNGWIQYLALLVPVYVFASYVQWFVFNNRVVHSVVKIDPLPDTKRQ